VAEETTPAAAAAASTEEATTAPVAAKKAKIEVAVESTPEQLEILKKRAERFGAIVAPAVESAVMADMKKKRQERFSTSTAATAEAAPATEPATPLSGPAVAPSVDIKTMSLEDRKKMRAERFK
jgi:hypothetical protein